MKYEEVIILLPCHSLEDFPLHHTGEDAAGLLAAWTAMWHPALIAATGSAPQWQRVDDPPTQLANRLLLVPSVSQTELPTGFTQRAKDEGACVIRAKQCRREILEQALAELDGGDQGISEECLADFAALGYCYLQVELLTRQMRYASNLDEVHFNNQVVAAAQAAVAGDAEKSRGHLVACFDVLGEERDHYYSVDAYVLDLTMVAPTTLGEPLRRELQNPAPLNLLLDGETLQKLAAEHPDLLALLRERLEAGTASIVGGEVQPLPHALVSSETTLGELSRARDEYQRHLGRAPQVYGRYRFGLAPTLPQVLQRLGYAGALHAGFEEGTSPQGSQLKVRWEGPGSLGLEALARSPQNANLAETFLGYALKMGESMDTDYVAAVCLAHWPGKVSPWYEDLRRTAQFGNALGRFVTMDAFFRDTAITGQSERFKADQYRSPLLRQAIIREQADPISRSVRYWQRRAQADAIRSFQTLATLIRPPSSPPDTAALAERVDNAAEKDNDPELDADLARQLEQSVETLASSLPQVEQTGDSYLVLNPFSLVRRMGLEDPAIPASVPIERPVYSASPTERGATQVVVDVPAMGFLWVSGGTPSKPSGKAPQPLVEENILRNEFFEAVINPTTGTLQSIHEYKSRGNRISQQLAVRLGERRGSPDSWADEGDGEYSVMAADEVQTLCSTPTCGEVGVRGRLLDKEGGVLSRFRQVYRLWRGSRVLELDIELEPEFVLKADPWKSYYAARFAWSDEGAEVTRLINGSRQPAENKRLEAPLYIDMDTGDTRVTLLTGGIPYHRRVGLRMLDSLLRVRHETQQTFRMGIGIGLAHPAHDALALLLPTQGRAMPGRGPRGPNHGWLFHVDARNVVATSWEPMWDESGRRVIGARTRIQEMEGRASRPTLRCFRPVASARQTDFRGEPIQDCRVEDDAVRLDVSAHEWLQIELLWKE